MQKFNRFNKVTGVYNLKLSPDNLEIKIILKPQDNIIALPKYEDFDNTNSINIDQFETKYEKHVIKWQEKVFNQHEIQYYSDKRNCVSDIENDYHTMIKENNSKFGQVFTYVNKDFFNPYPFEDNVASDYTKVNNLCNFFEKFGIRDRVNNLITNNNDSTMHLLRDKHDVSVDKQQWISMHIMFDQSKYNEEVFVKQEAVLASIYFNPDTKCLIIRPDENNMDWNPYQVESSSGVSWNYQYGVEINLVENNDESDCEEFKNLLLKLQRKWDKKNSHLFEFITPSIGVKRHYVTFEILSGFDFDLDNLYIEYNIKLPDNCTCNEPLKGCTQITASGSSDDGPVWHFGHLLEFQIDCEVGLESPTIDIFLEIVSLGSWHIHRTEGYCHLPLQLTPGAGCRRLCSVRPEERNRVEAESRRFFLGGCHLLKDLDVLAKPQENIDPSFRLVGSGAVTVRWHTIRQSSDAIPSTSDRQRGRYSAKALIHGADAVLRQYRKAKARLAAATKDLDIVSL